MPEQTSPTDILRLFREDLDPIDRVNAFEQASEQLREQVETLASPERVAAINERFKLLFVFNSHGSDINAAQSIEAGGEPFISFVENAGDAEITDSGLFGFSVGNAFNMRFNGLSASKPLTYPGMATDDFGYWRDRGLLSKGSLIAPVDIRHYSRRLLDALMGNDYDQQFLSGTIPGYALRNKEIEKLLEEQRQKGLLVMHSNAVRELTSAKQVLETLQQLDEVEAGGANFGEENSDRLRALLQKARIAGDPLAANVIYGTGHHTMVHIYRKLGINVERIFPGKEDAPGNLSYSGAVLDQFFSSHPFGITDEKAQEYAAQLVMEGMLWEPITNTAEHGLIVRNRKVASKLWMTVMKAARQKNLTDNIESIHAEFRANPLSVVPILEAAGLEFIKID